MPKAKNLLDERHLIAANSFAELVVWDLPSPAFGSMHRFKYRLAFIVDGRCVLRYDNEFGKGDHKHIGDREFAYVFTTPEQLLEDFWNDVDQFRT